MTDRIEQQARRGADQLFQATKDLLDLVSGLGKRLIEIERRVADMQNGHTEPRFTLESPQCPAIGHGGISTQDTAPVAS